MQNVARKKRNESVIFVCCTKVLEMLDEVDENEGGWWVAV